MTKEEFLKRWSNELGRREKSYQARTANQKPSFTTFSRALGYARMMCDKNVPEEDRDETKKQVRAMMHDKLHEMGMTLFRDDEGLKELIESDPQSIVYIDLIKDDWDRRLFAQDILQKHPSMITSLTPEQLVQLFPKSGLRDLVRNVPDLLDYSPLPELMKADPELARKINSLKEVEDRAARIAKLESESASLSCKLNEAKQKLAELEAPTNIRTEEKGL